MTAAAAAIGRRRLLAPEVVQTSAMDCGPASLKCLLEGFGVPVSYGRLREACQTDVDGTSIDTLEELAVSLGFDASQVMLPIDHVLLPEAAALPAIVVVRQPSGLTHFVVVWARHGRFVQVMDPGAGRRWQTVEELLRSVYVHAMPVPAEGWREWAGSDAFTRPLATRLARLGLADRGRAQIAAALADPGWRRVAALDAAARMVESIARAGGLRRGGEAARALAALLDEAEKAPGVIPDAFWSARAAPPDPDGDGERVMLRGAVLVTVKGPRDAARAGDEEAAKQGDSRDEAPPLPPEIAAALAEPQAQPGRALLRMLLADGALTPAVIAAALALSAAGVALEALLFRGLFDLRWSLGLVEQRVLAAAALIAFLLALLLLDLPIAAGVQWLGRRLEARLRIAFLEKIPRLDDRYFQSRPASDMAERSHGIHRLRVLPAVGGRLLRAVLEIAATTIGIVWIDPASAPAAIAVAAAAIGLPLALGPLLSERDLRVRTHAGAMSTFYLDALLGLVAVRTHGAERAVRREHEGLLGEWSLAARSLLRLAVALDGAQAIVTFGLAGWLFASHLGRAGGAPGALLLLYWTLNLPVIGQEIGAVARQVPPHRNATLRLFEPLGALEAGAARDHETRPAQGDDGAALVPEVAAFSAARAHGAAVRVEGVSVRAGGHAILHDVDLALAPGEHVAVVGPSGAGKSSLVGLFLGWHRPSSGRIVVDGEELDGARVEALRNDVAWVDPAVQLWNRTLHENLAYGADARSGAIGRAIGAADLRAVLEKLPDGLQTQLGEGGALLSGGEGQRVRLARALGRRDARLVILDEPFRGLDRERRGALLGRAIAWWRRATLICITHDVGETRAFSRVIVIDGGRVVEDGAPAELAARAGSRYRALLDAEDRVRRTLWASAIWRRLRIDRGLLDEGPGGDA